MTMIKVFKVGGYVRDQIMGLYSKDIDYAVEAPSFDIMRQYIIDNGGQIFLETPQYFTIRCKINKEVADYVLCRKDGKYSDSRRPDEVIIGDIYDDLSRRDFTMNAIAIDENGNYIDPYGGIDDIKNRIIRCVGNSYDRFDEDALRILRAVRFAITKYMAIHEDIWACFMDEKLLMKLEKVSDDRVREELYKMFSCDTIKTLNMLESLPYHFKEILFQNFNIWLKPTSEVK